MGKKPDDDEQNDKKSLGGNLGDPYPGLMDGGSRTDYNNYDWSGKEVDNYQDVRKKGSDR